MLINKIPFAILVSNEMYTNVIYLAYVTAICWISVGEIPKKSNKSNGVRTIDAFSLVLVIVIILVVLYLYYLIVAQIVIF